MEKEKPPVNKEFKKGYDLGRRHEKKSIEELIEEIEDNECILGVDKLKVLKSRI